MIDKVRLEASSICQLRCPICPTSKKITDKSVVGSGYLKFNDFKEFLNNNPDIKLIELSNWGEIFLNPELADIIKYAQEKKVLLTAYNGVNFNNVSEEVLRCLVEYGFKGMTISLDGATSETYSKYRRNGSFDKVIENIKTVNKYKKEYGKTDPVLYWSFVIFGHNEHELPLAKKMAGQLNMLFTARLNFGDIFGVPDFSPVKDRDFVIKNSGLDVATTEEFKRKHKKNYIRVCQQLWDDPQINWDGKLLGCCHNMWGDFGNVFKDGLENCLESERYNYAKLMVAGKKKAREDIPCFKCNLYMGEMQLRCSLSYKVRLWVNKIFNAMRSFLIKQWYPVFLPFALYPRNSFRKIYRKIKDYITRNL